MVKSSPMAVNRHVPLQSITRLFVLFLNLPKLVSSQRIQSLIGLSLKREVNTPEELTNEEYWTYIIISIMLVLAGGVFAGLTLALMGQDEVYLKVISSSGDPEERKNSRKVLEILDKGKHWVLVTLLLSNVITNETLPIVLDRVLGGGWPAVVNSTVAIVIFGEVIPQSICVRYGLQIGAFFTPFVLILMYIMYPIAYPISVLLDKILGEDHGTMYKKSGLKTLVTLHRTMGAERLNNDEVTIISAVLDLKEKKVSEIMTPFKNVYTMSSDTILDDNCVEEIFNSGFSRIPIHLPNEPYNFVGMLLVRVLISYDPEDALPVSSFPLATLPETSPSTSCLNILNYFQEGKSHMVVVSERPGDSYGALGVLTLEDVIEELIGEEIVDESDVYVDIHKAIKREQPGPLSKKHLNQYLHSLYTLSNRHPVDTNQDSESFSNSNPFLLNHEVSGNAGLIQFKPSNLASNPLETKKSFVTIKRHQPTTQARLKYDYFDDEPGVTDNSGDLDGNISAPISTSGPTADYGTNDDTDRGLDKSIAYYKRNGLPVREPIDLNQYRKNSHSQVSSVPTTDRISIGGSSNHNASPELVKQPEIHNYRTGGIIESIVNVQGVHKTIIHSTQDEHAGISSFQSQESV
ncbi:hypothetical protein WICMUC_002619 [Wickerhamomyces mucosus]|uniref:CNNM transmembrane domain-containing protein n=1 Tax=Wickerhamomyces mucosus TaxID=1378264 RepID=A0A9P8TED7_9ASCO|nr:hypothetical protein WICMUC_002619 [Wickerhamomyces mucosus]